MTGTTTTIQQHLYAEFKRALWERDGGICGLCGYPVALEKAQIDHILPRSRNGSHSTENLQMAHGLCNARKCNGDHPKPSRQLPLPSPPRGKRPLKPVAPPANQPVLELSVQAMADRLRVNPETVRRWLRRGILRGVNMGDSGSRGWRIPVSEVERFTTSSEHPKP